MEKYNTYTNTGKTSGVSGYIFNHLSYTTLVVVICCLLGGFVIWGDDIFKSKQQPVIELPDAELVFMGKTLSSKCLAERIQDFRRIKVIANDSVAKLISIDNDLLAVISSCYITSTNTPAPVEEKTELEKIPLK